MDPCCITAQSIRWNELVSELMFGGWGSCYPCRLLPRTQFENPSRGSLFLVSTGFIRLDSAFLFIIASGLLSGDLDEL